MRRRARARAGGARGGVGRRGEGPLGARRGVFPVGGIRYTDFLTEFRCFFFSRDAIEVQSKKRKEGSTGKPKRGQEEAGEKRKDESDERRPRQHGKNEVHIKRTRKNVDTNPAENFVWIVSD